MQPEGSIVFTEALLLILFQSLMNLLHNLLPNSFKIQFNNILPSTPMFSKEFHHFICSD
jgi:hypothetical protein